MRWTLLPPLPCIPLLCSPRFNVYSRRLSCHFTIPILPIPQVLIGMQLPALWIAQSPLSKPTQTPMSRWQTSLGPPAYQCAPCSPLSGSNAKPLQSPIYVESDSTTPTMTSLWAILPSPQSLTSLPDGDSTTWE